MAETTKPAPEQQPARSTPTQPAQPGERQTVTIGGHELEVTPPTPTQEEADAIKERALTGEAPEGTPLGETAQQRAEREQREAKPAAPSSGYQTR